MPVPRELLTQRLTELRALLAEATEPPPDPVLDAPPTPLPPEVAKQIGAKRGDLVDRINKGIAARQQFAAGAAKAQETVKRVVADAVGRIDALLKKGPVE